MATTIEQESVRYEEVIEGEKTEATDTMDFKQAPQQQQQKIRQLVNWELLDDPNVIERCKEELKTDGVMCIPSFATQSGLEKLKKECRESPYNEISDTSQTPWQDQGDFSSYPADHPRNCFVTTSVAFVGRKALEKTPEKLGISMYYYPNSNNEVEDDNNVLSSSSSKLLSFVSEVASKSLYHSHDENGSVYSYRIHDTHNPQWHFDESHYTAILYLENNSSSREDDGGGEFCFVPSCRPTKSKDDPDGHEIVKEVCMDNDYSKVKKIQAIPGSMIFFSGAHTFHRAAPLVKSTSGSIDDGSSDDDNNKDGSDNNNIRLGLVFTFFEEKENSNSDNVKNFNNWDPETS